MTAIFTQDPPSDMKGNIPCQSYQNLCCVTCRFLSCGSTIRSATTNQLHNLPLDPTKKYNCQSKGVYALAGSGDCGKVQQYVGQTSRPLLKKRFWEHINNIRLWSRIDRDGGKRIAVSSYCKFYDHFRDTRCSFGYAKVLCEGSEAEEMQWIHLLKPSGNTTGVEKLTE